MAYKKDEKRFLEEVGKAIREAREKQGWSQEELGFQSGVHRTYAGAVERGERNLSLLSLWKITRSLKIPITSVLEEAERGK